MQSKMTLKEWLPLLGITVSAFIFNTSEFMPIGLLTDIADSFHITEAHAGVLITVYSWIVMLLSLPLMLLLNKIDFKRLLLGTIALFGIFQMLSAFSASYGMLMISRIGVACTHSVFWSIASPAAALHEIKKEGKEFTVTLSTNTIYSYIKKGIFLNITMEDLPEKKKQHKKKKVKVQKRVQAGDSISQRPEHIDFREEFGHWEMDTVVGPQGKSKKVMLVLTERKTRKEIVYLMPDRKAQTVVKTLNMIERKYGERLFRDVFKTITVDNGVEFSDSEGLEKSRRNKKKRTKVYYCHPYSSCERGSNENANRLIRRHIPKGVNFDKKSKTEIKEIETWINNYPRKIFEYDTAENQFINEMEKLTG